MSIKLSFFHIMIHVSVFFGDNRNTRFIHSHCRLKRLTVVSKQVLQKHCDMLTTVDQNAIVSTQFGTLPDIYGAYTNSIRVIMVLN